MSFSVREIVFGAFLGSPLDNVDPPEIQYSLQKKAFVTKAKSNLCFSSYPGSTPKKCLAWHKLGSLIRFGSEPLVSAIVYFSFNVFCCFSLDHHIIARLSDLSPRKGCSYLCRCLTQYPQCVVCCKISRRACAPVFSERNSEVFVNSFHHPTALSENRCKMRCVSTCSTAFLFAPRPLNE